MASSFFKQARNCQKKKMQPVTLKSMKLLIQSFELETWHRASFYF